MVALTDFTVLTELATAGTPATSVPSYTAITSYVMAGEGITLSRGRSSERDSTAQAGTAGVTVRNTDQRFTMGNGSSPYAPLQIRRPCRFRVTYSASTYALWQGFVDDWGNGREHLTGKARLSLSDRIARAGAKMTNQLAFDMLADSPQVLYRLDEPSGAATVQNAVTPTPVFEMVVPAGAPGATATFGTSGAPSPDGTTMLTLARAGLNSGKYLNGPSVVSGSGSGFTIEAWARRSTLAGGSGDQIVAAFPDANLHLVIDQAGTVSLVGLTATVTSTATTTTTELSHVAATVDAALDVTLYVNGVASGTGNLIASATAFNAFTIGGVYDGGIGYVLSMFDGDIAMVAVYGSVLSAGRILSHYQGGHNGWSGELSGARFSRWCAQAGLPSAFYATDTGTSTMGAQPVAGRTLIEVLSAVADAEGGFVYVDEAGILRLSGRAARFAATVGLTLDASKAGQVLDSFGLVTNDQFLLNDYTVTIPDGYSARVQDTTSQDSYDVHDAEETLYLDSGTQALAKAQWDVYNLKTPAARSDTIDVDLVAYANSGGNVANLLNADIGTKVTVTNLPTDISSTSSLSFYIDGIRHRITKSQWIVSLTTSPVGQYASVALLNDATLGKLDTGGVLAW